MCTAERDMFNITFLEANGYCNIWNPAGVMRKQNGILILLIVHIS